jgi:hypothetical protein
MATNEIIISHLNPQEFSPKFPTVFPQYGSKDLGDYPFQERIQAWQEKVYYKQKWQTSDTMFYQFESNFSPIQIDLYNVLYRDPVVTIVLNQVAANPQIPGMYIYQGAIQFAGLDEGWYYTELSPGTNPANVQVSEPIELKIKTVEPSIYYEYKHSHFHGDVIFETGIQFAFRVEGSLGKLYPVSDDTFYRDQKLNPYQLSSKPRESYDLSMGGSFGVPDWVVRKINWIWSCDSVMMNGKSYGKDPGNNNSSQGIQINEEDDYPLYGLTMLVAPGINRASKIINPSVDTNKRLLVVAITDGTLFGDLSVNVGDNLIPINTIE